MSMDIFQEETYWNSQFNLAIQYKNNEASSRLNTALQYMYMVLCAFSKALFLFCFSSVQPLKEIK